MAYKVDPEAAVRSYLLALSDPAALVDQAAIEALRASVDAATDPIAKLRTLTELHRAQAPDVSAYERNFVKHARRWAVSAGVDVASFKELGVPTQVLRAAGIVDDGPSRGPSSRSEERSTSAATKDAIKTHALTMVGPFTMIDLAAQAGGSPMTLRRAVHELLEDGRLENRGTSEHHVGRGRSPIMYAVAHIERKTRLRKPRAK